MNFEPIITMLSFKSEGVIKMFLGIQSLRMSSEDQHWKNLKEIIREVSIEDAARDVIKIIK